ncbi:MAG: orotate phosphoribosyltransferase [Flavobacteriales bacterium]
MKIADDTAAKVAEFLLRIKAVELAPNKPFRWSSGLLSPIYCDNRKVLSHPRIRTHIRQQLSERVQEEFGKPDAIVGVATGGIAIGALLAQELGIPFAYVRSEPKGHGKENVIEGDLEKRAGIVVIEDLISTGKSSLHAVQNLKDEGYRVKGLAAIFSYGFEEAAERFREAECRFTVLTDHETLIRKASDQGTVSKEELETLEDWRKDPVEWGKRMDLS